MKIITQSIIPFSTASLHRARAWSAGYYLSLLATCLWLSATPAVDAINFGPEAGTGAGKTAMTLVFSDDFATDPNTNGQWTIHRYAGDLKSEAAWDASVGAWDLTRATANKGVAVFANYELTATTWRAEFRYRAAKLGGLQQGGDGFVFMFYKNKGAYGVPAFGAGTGFELATGGPVAGYGLRFDNYIQGCDPATTDYFALIKDDVCSFLGGEETDWVGGSVWHKVEFVFSEGNIRVTIDGGTTFKAQLAEPDYSYAIDNFRLWVSE